MPVVANITWSPVPGSYGTKVEFRKESDVLWTLPTTPTNPTLITTYPITIDEDEYYLVKLTTLSNQCANGSIIKRIIYRTGGCCPSGWTLAPDGSYCFQIDSIVATPPTGGVAQIAVAASLIPYSSCGSFIYNPGYAIDGTGAGVPVNPSNPFWKNAGDCTGANAIDGPMNRCALWTAVASSNQQVGFSVCINIPSTKTYYLGVGCDNNAIIKVDGVVIIQQSESAVNAQHGNTGSCFKVWHIYPITLTSGFHIIEMIGNNISGDAGFGAEIYDNTPSEIQSAIAYSGLNLIFSTKDKRGQPIEIGSGGTGYSCPSGYSLNSCDPPFYCTRVSNTPTVPC